MLADGRRGVALLLLDAAARLHGNTEKGRRARIQARTLARVLEHEQSEPPAPR
jgi:hypothetical protein